MAIEPKKINIKPLTGQEAWNAGSLRSSRHTLEDLKGIGEKGLTTHEGRRGLASYLHGDQNALNDANDQTIAQGYDYIQKGINSGRLAYVANHIPETIKQTGEPIVQHKILHTPDFKFYKGEGDNYNAIVAAISTAQTAIAERQDQEKTNAFIAEKITNNSNLSVFEKGYWSLFSENMLDARVKDAIDKYNATVPSYGFARAVKDNIKVMNAQATQYDAKSKELSDKLNEMAAVKVKQLGREELVLQGMEPLTAAEMADVRSAWSAQYKPQLEAINKYAGAGKDLNNALSMVLRLYDAVDNQKEAEAKATNEKAKADTSTKKK